MHGAGTLVFTAQDQLLAPGEQQLTLHRIDPVVHRCDAYRLARLEAIGIDKILVRECCRRCLARHGDSLFAAHLAQ